MKENNHDGIESNPKINDENNTPVGIFTLHFTRKNIINKGKNIIRSHQDEKKEILNVSSKISSFHKIPMNEFVCMLDIEDATALEIANHEDLQSDDRLLWSEKTNIHKLGLCTFLIWCKGLVLIALGHFLLVQICGWMGECYTYLSPGVYWIAMLILLASISRFADTQYFRGKISAIENQMAIFIRRKSASTTFFFTNEKQSKMYQQGINPCPITLFYCRWKRMGICSENEGSSFIKLAYFVVPKETGLQVPVTCDVIDTLRASFRSTGLSFMNYHGILVANISEISEESQHMLMTFLFRSGFSILCNDTETGLVVAMKRMGGYGTWKLHKIEYPFQSVSSTSSSILVLSICLHFIPSKLFSIS